MQQAPEAYANKDGHLLKGELLDWFVLDYKTNLRPIMLCTLFKRTLRLNGFCR